MNKSLIALTCLVSLSATAATEDCHNIKLESVTVEGPRDDNHFFANKLVLKLDQECSGKSYAHADLSHPAFNGFLSVALAAKNSNLAVTVSVNSSKQTDLSNQIAYLSY